MAKKPDPFNFEKALEELEVLVNRIERGDLTLEDSLTAFERGVGITRDCQKALDAAEQKVEVLVAQAGEGTPDAETAPDS